MTIKKIICLFLITFLAYGSITKTSALENDTIIDPRYGNNISYEYHFCNFQTTPASIESIIGSNGGISITVNPNVSNANYTMSFELVRNGSRTGNIKTVPMVKGKFVSWGDLPSGKYQIRITSSYADYYQNKYATGTINVYFGD